MRSLSPGLRAARYPGCVSGVEINPERVVSVVSFTVVNPTRFGGEDRMHENPGQRLRYDGENAQRRGEAATLSGLGKCGGWVVRLPGLVGLGDPAGRRQNHGRRRPRFGSA